MPDEVNRYRVMMKMLEIIEQDIVGAEYHPTMEDLEKMAAIVSRFGRAVIVQNVEPGGMVEMGDKFENIQQSVIATRGSLAEGTIEVQQSSGDDIVDALHLIQGAATSDEANAETEVLRNEIAELAAELEKMQAENVAPKFVLKAVGEKLLELCKASTPMAQVALKVWPAIEKIWK